MTPPRSSTDLVEGGQEIPYEIGEPGDGFAFCQYQPLTARFVRDNATELRELESFHEATETMRRTDIAGPYLEEAGIAPPVDAVERATLAVTYFLARLWDGSADFEIDDERFASTVAEIEECAEPETGEVEAIVPLVGFQMPVDATRAERRLDRPRRRRRRPRRGGSRRAARRRRLGAHLPDQRPRRPRRRRWPRRRRRACRPDLRARRHDAAPLQARRRRARPARLGPGRRRPLAPDRDRRGRPRPGGYRLTETDLEAVSDLSRTVAVHPRRVTRLRRALLRFEAGLDRRGAVDALNDHLLALRFLLEGEGPAGVGLPMRVAALAEGRRRTQRRQGGRRAGDLARA